jgi:hypothetical protein
VPFLRSNIHPAVVSVSKTARVSAISSSTGWFDKFITADTTVVSCQAEKQIDISSGPALCLR